MQDWYREHNIFLIVAIILMVAFTVLYVQGILRAEYKKKTKYNKVLYPEEYEKFSEVEDKAKKNKKTKIGNRINAYLEKKGINSKIKSLYTRAGKTNKTTKDLAFDMIKYLILGVGVFFGLYYAIANYLIAGMVGLFIIAFPALNLYSKIKSREQKFRNDFPYFLQTIAFVLKNGTNFSQAFYEVVNKQEDTVLKEVMLDVLTIQNVNAGDYKIAFKSMTDKIKIEEVSEFVNVVIDNLEKGVSIADVFLNQAENTAKILNLSIKKKISAVSTKILLPILLLCAAIGILFINL